MRFPLPQLLEIKQRAVAGEKGMAEVRERGEFRHRSILRHVQDFAIHLPIPRQLSGCAWDILGWGGTPAVLTALGGGRIGLSE
jgi:hypothetical protein